MVSTGSGFWQQDNVFLSHTHTHTHTDILSLMRADKLLCAVGHVARHSLGAGKETQRGGRILEEFKYQFVDHVT